jgi:pimeloyl-ACP methyl ester carboxylesterase
MKEQHLLQIGKLLNSLSTLAPRLIGELIFHFFSKPLQKLGFTPLRKKFLNRSNKNITKIEDHQIAHYHWPNSGPAVLLLHGWESNSGRWKSLVDELLAEKYSVYAFDAPAHGFSSGKRATPILYAKIADYFVKKYDIKHLIGHSFGGYTVIYYGYDFKHSLESITALAPTNSIRDVVNGMKKALRLTPQTITAFDGVFKKHYGDSPDAFDAAEFAKSIQTRGFIVHDEYDLVLPVSGSQKISNAWKNSLFMKTEGLGHRLVSKKLDQKILQFINKK